MMPRFCAYVEKVFQLGTRLQTLRDGRQRPAIPVAGVFAWAFAMFATGRRSLHGMEADRQVPSRFQGFVGPRVPSDDTTGRVYASMESQPLREMLRDIAQQMKRNKVFANGGDWQFAAVDGHEFFRQPEALVPPLPEPHADHRWKGSDRVLSPRRGLPSRGARPGAAVGCRVAPTG